MRKTIKSVLYSIAQVLLFVVSYKILWCVAIMIFSPRNNLQWGLTVEYSVIAIAPLISIVNILIVLINSSKLKVVLLLLALLLFGLLNINNLYYTPYRFSFLMIIAIISFLPSLILIDWKGNKE